ncbi:MAG TPA: o-succinylbenzoate synthase [Clostridiaceae bacterium]|nr:o-succinylbenzoate synthase [Clostridiaceae bacterium]
MRIDRIEVYYVKNPMISPWRTAYGEDADIYSILVKMCSDEHSGWAEASPLFAPTYSPEFAYGVYHLVCKMFAPLIIGKDIESAQEINNILSVFKGNPFAKSALEMAWWVLKANMEKKPLHKLLGGSSDEVEVGADFGITDNIDELLVKIQGAVSAGFKRVKLKVKPGKDIDVLREVRKNFPNHTFHIDCNSGYTLDDLPLFKEIDKFGLAMIEQPLYHMDLIDHAKLQKAIETPICLDESCNSIYAAQKAIELGSCKYINIKPGRVGGISNSLEIIRMCEEAGIGNWIGGMLETSIGAGICIELATLNNMTYPSDLFSSDTYYKKDISFEPIVYSSPGKMKPSQVPGTPYLPDPAILKERTIFSEVIELSE